MMINYFESLVDNLTIDDIELLNILTSKESNAKFSSKSKQDILEISDLTETKFRKSVIKLEALNFINTSIINRKQMLFVTEYGQKAIQIIFERGNA